MVFLEEVVDHSFIICKTKFRSSCERHSVAEGSIIVVREQDVKNPTM